MLAIVVNLDSQPDRWFDTRYHLTQFGLPVVRWPATSPVEGPVKWVGRNGDCQMRIAIIRTYRALLETIDCETLIMQDDIRLTRHPYRESGADIYLYGGYRSPKATERNHICPYAFRVHPRAVPKILECLRDETRQMCELWPPALRDAAFDAKATAYAY